uniref:VWFA domain-containing protein n=1 Tax=Echeneis naucrates TaxID=173247 RepID=A0A665UVY5_ECHNA
VSVVQHSERPTPNFYLNTYQTKDEVLRAVNQLTPVGGRSLNTGSAIRFMKDTIFSDRNGGRAAQMVPQFNIILTGGRSRDNVKEPAGALKTGGVIPFGVGVKNADPKQIEAISHNPSFAFNVREFSELTTQTHPPVLLEQSNSLQRDIVFLLDGSEDTRSGFPVMKSFVQRLVETLSIGENKDRVSVVQYSRDPKTHFYLNTYMEKRDILNALQEINHKGGGPRNTGAALDYVRHNTFTDSSGSRYQEGIPQILILLSGGRSQDDVASAAVALKQHKVVPLCVGTRKADILELQMIAHNPSYAFTVPRFDDIGSIYQQLVSFVKRVPRQQPRLKPENILGKKIYLSIYLSIISLYVTLTEHHLCVRERFYRSN